MSSAAQEEDPRPGGLIADLSRELDEIESWRAELRDRVDALKARAAAAGVHWGAFRLAHKLRALELAERRQYKLTLEDAGVQLELW